jgi:hypothetical protein
MGVVVQLEQRKCIITIYIYYCRHAYKNGSGDDSPVMNEKDKGALIAAGRMWERGCRDGARAYG